MQKVAAGFPVRVWLLLCLVFVWAALLLGGLTLSLAPAVARPLNDWSGELTEDTTFDPANNPYIISANLIVPDGVTLTVLPGVEMRFADAATSLIVRGRLLAVGTPTQTIRFTWLNEGTYWREIIFDETLYDNRIAYAEIAYMLGVESQWSRFTLLNSEVHDTYGDAVRCDGGVITIQGNHIYNVTHKDHGCEGVQINQMLPESPSYVVGNYIHHINDDCLDINDSSVFVERNHFHDCGDKGISIGTIGDVREGTQPPSVTVVNTLVYSAYYGIAVKDSSFAQIVHSTLVGNEYGLALYEALDHPGWGGGHAKVVNAILWGNHKYDLFLGPGAPSTVTVAYSDIAGGWEGTGNLDVTPGFRGTDVFRLQEDSPLIDAGRDVGVALDLDGLPRWVGAAPDIGAYELQSGLSLSAWPGDQQANLAWRLLGSNPALASFAISYTLYPIGTMTIVPLPVTPTVLITDVPTSTRAYTLTNLHNYVRYVVVVEARDAEGAVLLRSNVVSVVPSDHRLYLPLIVRGGAP